MRLGRDFRFVICCVHGNLILSVCKRLNLNGLLVEWSEVYGVVHMLTGCIWVQKVLLEVLY